jgi:ferritin-like metal-binding protein YciE
MAISTLKDLLVDQLRDLYNAETQARRAYDRWAQDAQSEALTDLFTDRLETTSRHINRVQEICNAMNRNVAGKKCHGMEGLIAEGDEFLSDATDGPVRDAGLVANAQRLEHYFIAGYGCARAYAQQLDRTEAAAALQKNIESCVAADEAMTTAADQVLNPEAQTTEAAAR